MPDQASSSTPTPKLVRGCDGCTLCCKIFTVTELVKPGNEWCPHCIRGTGCGIYDRRPKDCAEFICGYLLMPNLGPEWKPAISHLVISSEFSEKRINIHVDQGRPDAWRKQPYYRMIKEWSRQALPRGEMVIVMLGLRCFVPLPDRDVDLGVVRGDQLIVIGERLTGTGPVYEPYLVKRDADLGRRIAGAGDMPVMVTPDDSDDLVRGRTVV
jgi:hypothetical protein